MPTNRRQNGEGIGTSLSSLCQCVERAPGRHLGFCGEPRQVYLSFSTLRNGNILMVEIMKCFVSDPVEQAAVTQQNATKK